jgi:hypothetical protein
MGHSPDAPPSAPTSAAELRELRAPISDLSGSMVEWYNLIKESDE